MAQLSNSAIIVIILVGAGLGLLMFYAIARFFFMKNSSDASDQSRFMPQPEQAQYMSSVRTRERSMLGVPPGYHAKNFGYANGSARTSYGPTSGYYSGPTSPGIMTPAINTPMDEKKAADVAVHPAYAEGSYSPPPAVDAKKDEKAAEVKIASVKEDV